MQRLSFTVGIRRDLGFDASSGTIVIALVGQWTPAFVSHLLVALITWAWLHDGGWAPREWAETCNISWNLVWKLAHHLLLTEASPSSVQIQQVEKEVAPLNERAVKSHCKEWRWREGWRNGTRLQLPFTMIVKKMMMIVKSYLTLIVYQKGLP